MQYVLAGGKRLGISCFLGMQTSGIIQMAPSFDQASEPEQLCGGVSSHWPSVLLHSSTVGNSNYCLRDTVGDLSNHYMYIPPWHVPTKVAYILWIM